MSAPLVSVVLATHDREQMLATALAALDAQEGATYEVIVVDDCSTDGTAALLASEPVRRARRFTSLRTDVNRGPAGARNLGWRAARGTWVAFTDDDCEVDSRWLAHLMAVADATGCAIVQGRTLPNPAHLASTPWVRTVTVPSFSGRFETCNLLVRRDVLEELGGFDEAYPFAGEDADLGWRAVKADHRAEFAPDALVLHAVRPQTLRDHLRSKMAWARLVRFYRLHPEARGLLWGRLFHRRAHLTASAALCGIAAAGLVLGWWWSVLLYAAYAGNIARRAGSSGRSPLDRLRYGLMAPLADVWEAMNFAWWSLRYRTLVL